MTLRPPANAGSAGTDPLAAALEQEILNEKASTLARLTGKLERALACLKEIETAEGSAADAYQRQLAEAGEALWHVSIQRELCGLRGHTAFYDFMGVPKAVRLRMGPASSTLKSQEPGQTQGL